MTSADAVVLGAGPAGLAAAWRAAVAGRSVVVLERAPHVGGMAASFEICGVRVDHGSHRLHPSIDPRILAELQRLLGNDLQTRPRQGRIRLANRWIDFPLRSGDLFRNMPVRFAAGVAIDAVTSPLRTEHADTYAEVVRAGLGPTMLREFYGPYAKKLWGRDATELTGEQARRRVAASSPVDILKRLAAAQRPGAGTFLYPRRGFGQIAESIAETASAAGADIRTGSAVTAVSGTIVRLATGESIEGERIWSTIPLSALAALADPGPPSIPSLEHRAMVLLYLAFDRQQWTPFDAHYLPSLDTPISRISEPKNYRDGPDPNGATVICCEIPCSVGDTTWNMEADELAQRASDDLRRYGLPSPTPIEVGVRKLPAAYPVYAPGYDRAFDELDAWVTRQPNLLSFGRLGLFAHDNTHHAMAMAWAAAETLDDPDSWAQARRRFESHVVED